MACAKRRVRSRKGEAGAAMFIVAMTLAVLASVGIYALAAAASEVRTSGNERQNTQTHYLAEYGIIAAAHELTTSNAQFNIGVALGNNVAGGGGRDSPCLALPNVPTNAEPITLACRRLGVTELGKQWGASATIPYASTQAFAPGVTPGSLGPTPVGGDFFVEMTEPSDANAPARYALNQNLCFKAVTVTANGITKPIVPGADPTPQVAGEGIEVQRARLIAGPMKCGTN